MLHDDGQHTDDLESADIVLVGVSRTSKSPTSIYLANRGVKTANVPLVPGIAAAASGRAADQAAGRRPLSPAPSASFRSARTACSASSAHRDGDRYVDRQAVAEEIAFSRKLCARHGWPLIDVTRRSIEETAAAVMALLVERRRQAAS